MTVATYTPCIPDTLAFACKGNLNMAGFAARIAAFINNSESGCVTLTLGYVCNLYGWTMNTVKRYITELQKMCILDVKIGAYKGTQTEWRKGANFDTYFNLAKISKNDTFNNTQRYQILTGKVSNFDTKNKYINKNNNKYNNIKDFACGDEVSLNTFFKLCGTTDTREAADKGCGLWEQLPFDKKRGIWYKKIG